jgi:hypothetical protein
MPRRAADPERTRSVLQLCAVLAFGLGVVAAASALVPSLGDVVFGDTALSGLRRTVLTLLVAAVLAGLGVGCLRLARDDGRGTWCAECVTRNPEGATTCERCGAVLG